MTNQTAPTVLISSAGRRVELLRAFRRTLETFPDGHRRHGGRVLAVDCSWYSSAYHDADEAFLVPRCTDPDFVATMVGLCEAHHVDLLVPTIDPELPIYAANREQFAAVGTTVAISSPEVVAIAGDKVLTHSWLSREGFPTVTQGSFADVRSEPYQWRFPLVLKPRFGSASKGVSVIETPGELERTVKDWIRVSHGGANPERDLVVQSVASGTEHTVDVLVTRKNNGDRTAPRLAAVPRRRIEVRAGEVSQAVTVRSPVLMELAEKVCWVLPGAFGPLNIQMFLDADSEEVAVIEINARFGGGYPLSFVAGADFPRALLQMALRLPVTASLDGWCEDLVMLRYDAAIFAHATSSGSRPAL